MKIAIVGSAPSSMHLAPYDDPDWEIWGINEQYHQMPRWDRWFHLHSRKLCVEGLADKAGCWKWLTTDHGKPVYLIEHMPEVPGCQVYPLQTILDRYGGYFTNSISFLIAYAVYLIEESREPSELAIYGVDMAHSSEYGDQRASCEYYIGLARGKGIPVYIPPESELLKTPYLYGFEDMPEVLQKARNTLLQDKGMFEKFQAEAQEKMNYANYWKGCYERSEYFYKNWTINGSLQKPI